MKITYADFKKKKLTKDQKKALFEAIAALRKARVISRIFVFDGENWDFFEIEPIPCPTGDDPQGPPTRCLNPSCNRVPWVNPCPKCCYWYCSCDTRYQRLLPRTTANCPACGRPRVTSQSCP